jgi:hypothetical protein
MNALRRKSSAGFTHHVAAEVLEVRALLSAAAAVVHHTTAPTTTKAYQGSASGHVQEGFGSSLDPPTDFTGTLTLNAMQLKNGASIKGHFTGTGTVGLGHHTYNVAFKGKITSFFIGGFTTVTVAAKGAGFVDTVAKPGQGKVVAKTALLPLTFTFDSNGNFVRVNGKFQTAPHGSTGPEVALFEIDAV